MIGISSFGWELLDLSVGVKELHLALGLKVNSLILLSESRSQQSVADLGVLFLVLNLTFHYHKYYWLNG